jgi:hypothetical protein
MVATDATLNIFFDSNRYSIRFMVNGKVINVVHSAGFTMLQIQEAMERFVLNAQGEFVVAELYDVQNQKVVDRLWRKQRKLAIDN